MRTSNRRTVTLGSRGVFLFCAIISWGAAGFAEHGSKAAADTSEGVMSPLAILPVDQDESYASLSASARTSNKIFFGDLSILGFARGLFRADAPDAFIPGLMFAQYQSAPLKIYDQCEAVFCRDVDLQRRLSEERDRGRLILVANAFNGFNAAVVSETPETEALKEVLLPKDGPKLKNVLIVTPKTLMSTLAHELTHAEDEEKGSLQPLVAETRTLFRAGRLAVANGRTINQFAGEIRAYENERKDLQSSARLREWVVDDRPAAEGARPSAVMVKTFPKKEFLARRLAEIEWKVKEWYLPRFLKAVRDPLLGLKDRRNLLATVRELLPTEGPYSFPRLVQPRL